MNKSFVYAKRVISCFSCMVMALMIAGQASESPILDSFRIDNFESFESFLQIHQDSLLKDDSTKLKIVDILLKEADKSRLNLESEKCEKILDLALSIMKQLATIDSSKLASIHTALGDIASTNTKIIKATENLKKSKELYSALNDTLNYLHSKNLLSSIYSKNYLFEEAKNERSEIYQNKGHRFRFILASAYLYESLDQRRQANYRSEADFLLKALEYGKIETVNPLILLFTHGFLSGTYANLNIPDSSNYHLLKMEEYLPLYENSKRISAYYPYVKAHNAYVNKQFNEAIKYSKLDLKTAYESVEAEHIYFSELLAIEIYKAIGDVEQAFAHLNAYQVVKDSIYAIAKTNQFNYYHAIYEDEKNKNLINIQKGNIQLLNQKISSKNRMLILGGIVVSLFMTLFYLIMRYNQIKKRKKSTRKIY